jgi:hypothetical protein
LPPGKDDFLTSRQNPLPILMKLIDSVVDLLADGRLKLSLACQALESD